MSKEKRFLTNSEIEDICDNIPKPIAFINEVYKSLHLQIKNKIRTQLSEYIIYPQQIDKLKNEIKRQFEKSIITPGEPIGLTAGEAIGQQITQMNLNTFHVSGSSKIIETSSLRILLNATTLQNPITTVHFLNKSMTFDEVLNFENELVQITVDDLLLSHEILISKNHIKEWWYSIYCKLKNIDLSSMEYFLRLKFNTFSMYDKNITLSYIIEKCFNNFDDSIICIMSPSNIGIVDIYINDGHLLSKSKCKIDKFILDNEKIESIFNDCIVKSFTSKIISGIAGYKNLNPITVNTLNIVKYEKYLFDDEYIIYTDFLITINEGITISKLENLLTKCEIKIKSKSLSDNSLVIIPPPFFTSTIISNISSVFTDVESEIKFKSIKFLFENNTMKIKFTDIFINDVLINSGNKINSEDLILTLQKYNVKIIDGFVEKNWKKNMISNFCDKFFEYSDLVVNEKEFSFYIKKSIKKFIDILYNNEMNNFTIHDKNNKLLGKKIDDFNYKIIPEYTYTYGEILGIDLKELDNNYYPLKELLCNPLIDKKYTISNNIKEIFKIFDIEVARNIICLFSHKIFKSNNSYINPRHFCFLSDYMTNTGVVIPITSKSISKQNRGVFADASFEQPVDFFIKSAFSGRIESAKYTSPSIFMGKRIAIGTGAFNIKLNTKVLKKLDKLNEDKKYDNPYDDIDLEEENNNFVNSNFETINDDNFELPDIKKMDIPEFLNDIFTDQVKNNYLISKDEIDDFLNFDF
jgi:hypothetical protein